MPWTVMVWRSRLPRFFSTPISGVKAIDVDLARHPYGIHRLDFFQATAGLNILGDQLLGRLGRSRRRKTKDSEHYLQDCAHGWSLLFTHEAVDVTGPARLFDVQQGAG